MDRRNPSPLSESSTRGPAGPFFRRLDWIAFWTATLISFAVYFYTLPPTVTLEDSGELAVAGDFLGVPHPPGYPIWSTLVWLFARVFSFVTYRGQPNPAWAIALASAVFGALASGLTAMLLCRSGSDLLRESRHALHATTEKTEDVFAWVAGVASSLLLAFSPVVWSQSVIVEVYSLNALFLVLIYLLVYRWLRQPSDRLLFVTAYLFGLGLTNYQVLLLIAPALVAVILLRDLDLFRDFVITLAPFLLVFGLVKLEVLPPIRHPLHWTGVVYVLGNFAVLATAFWVLPRGRAVAISLLLFELGVAYYGYMPLVSDLRNPPMNWAYPRTWEGFLHAITRGQYEKITPSDMFSLQFLEQVGAYLTDLRATFSVLAAPLGFLPFVTWQIRVGKHRLQALYPAAALMAAAIVLAVLHRFLGLEVLETPFKLLFAAALPFVAIGGTALLAARGEVFWHTLLDSKARPTDRLMAAVVLLVAAVAAIAFVTLMGRNVLLITEPLRSASPPGEGADAWRLLLKAGGVTAAALAPFALLFAVLGLMHSRFELSMTLDDQAQKWLVATLLGFLTMSVLLVSLANLKPEIQDMFIQRVKFISSHALFAFWIGYGALFGLAMVDHLFRGNRLLRWGAAAAVFLLPLIPIHQNYANPELIRRYGGAEQNGHDFGWQFGNYQLRGAEAILEELDPDEEPLPHPEFPPAMEPDAIFFGGTDPGRFVPTYMIYSARVREDVYLITQNALADNTYMAVMRDLYGDRIWIPAQPDSARAFQRYVEEVQAGKRPRNAQLQIRDGRVQVSGALGVMEINGILAQMIFEHNNYRHAFYVEESYVIPWMYPYLEPHGLIMKINRSPDEDHLTPPVVREDTDFWDWYVRRLTASEKFLRDVVARKSFSKLRSAIAGLYANRGRLHEAENAFQEARILYPLSPEANFRLVQEVLMPMRRLRESRLIMADFQKQDPGNTKVPEFLNYLASIERLERRVSELEEDLRKGAIDINRALELAEVYQQLGRLGPLLNLTANMLQNENLPAQVFYRLAQTLSRAGRHAEAVRALDLCLAKMPADAPSATYLDMARMYAAAQALDKTAAVLQSYLRREPMDWKAWMDLATMQVVQGQRDPAVRSLEQAVRAGGESAVQTIQQDPRLAPLLPQAMQRASAILPWPGLPITPAR